MTYSADTQAANRQELCDNIELEMIARGII
jgi:hypothetical protein